MATVGAFALRAGLRSLTPGPAASARLGRVAALHEFDPDAPADLEPGSVVYIPSKRWSALAAPQGLAAELRSAGGIAVVVDNDDRALPPEFVAECVRQSLPVYLIPKAVSFEQLGAALAAETYGTPAGDVHAAGPVAVRAVLDRFIGGTTLRAWLVTRGSAIGGSHSTDIELLVKLLSRKPVAPDRIPNSAAALHIPLPESGHALVLANPDRLAVAPRRLTGLLRHIDALARAMEVKRAARQEFENALIRELVEAKAASGALDPWARSLGLEPGTRVRAIATAADAGAGARMVAALQDLGSLGGSSCVAGVHGDSAYALITLGEQEFAEPGEPAPFEQAVQVLDALFEFRHGTAPPIGTSSFVMRDSNDLVRGLINARQLADRQARATRPAPDRIPLPSPLAATLLAAEPQLSVILDRALLQPVVDYDRDKGSRYLDTLRTFLALDGHFAATAAELGIHINTLRYRLTRIERLTGRGVQSTADRVDFYLALCLRELPRHDE
ncbi:helix-turn-helix domain-containing protein [Nocardia sp. NPDC004568]|uniref:PucR family transcriptional regulator n=1 Tax=Nocardia sp. NPDC004568 TaxID=3154551 RepID=UPI0033A436A2